MDKKPSKFGAFSPAPASPAVEEAPVAAPAPTRAKPARNRGGRGVVAPGDAPVTFSLRLPRKTWQDARLLSTYTMRPLADLVIEGLALIAEREGHPFEVPKRTGSE